MTDNKPWIGPVFLGIGVIIIVFCIIFVVSTLSKERAEERAYEGRKCIDACPQYDAEFANITESYRDIECWCRRDKDPLRIW